VPVRSSPSGSNRLAGERVAREYFDAHWDSQRGEVVASERVKLYGLTLVARRPVSYGAIDPAAARDVFVREALVAGDATIKAPVLERNRRLLSEVAELEHRARTPGRARR
jgi:ATP-dependent helicase HrpA